MDNDMAKMKIWFHDDWSTTIICYNTRGDAVPYYKIFAADRYYVLRDFMKKTYNSLDFKYPPSRIEIYIEKEIKEMEKTDLKYDKSLGYWVTAKGWKGCDSVIRIYLVK